MAKGGTGREKIWRQEHELGGCGKCPGKRGEGSEDRGKEMGRRARMLEIVNNWN